MSKPRIAIVIGSIRPNRFADPAAQWIAAIARARGDLDIEVFDRNEIVTPWTS